MLRLALLALLAACTPVPDPKSDADDTAGPGDTDVEGGDEDGDGFLPSDGDCDDNDAAINPDAEEICDNVDNDCDDSVDEDVIGAFFADTDGDGFGGDTVAVGCEAVEGFVDNSDDCDDAVASTYPGAEEVCDAVDNDCDGSADEGLEQAFWTDADGDGHGDADAPLFACEAPEGAASTNDDCDDGNGAIHPGADESDCLDPTDYNCDGSVGYADGDADGFAACEECDDTDAAVSPDGVETCNAIDDDCDGELDEAGSVGELTWYTDGDADGFGDAASPVTACEATDGLVADATDCDDATATVYPGAEETCNDVDDDCNGAVDDTPGGTWFTDADGDGYGDPDAIVYGCDAPAGAVADGTDCDDTTFAVNPGAAEVCNDLDDNCDGTADEGLDEAWYADVDGDGFGDAGAVTLACEQPAGTVTDATDCDDALAAINPAASETCNDTDDDCDGTLDEAAIDQPSWYYDADGDGYGNASAWASACDQPAGYVGNDDDCNDGAALASPAGTEVCDGIDNDCDGTSDEGGTTAWYRDADGDGYGNTASSVYACTAPAGYVAASADCNDATASVSPAAAEVCDTLDNDCDGSVDETGSLSFFEDADGDGYGDPTSVVAGCSLPAGYASNDDDCDDALAAVNPAGTETCDGIDEDCDGTVDDGAGTTWYRDTDGDGYGSTTTTTSCSEPSGYVDNDDDCLDSSSSYSPAAAEVCDDSLDQDCDGTADDGCPDTVEHCGTISADETWSGEDIHVVTCDVYVQGTANPLLTIEDGATVQFAAGAGMYVGWSSYGELWIDGHTDGVSVTSDQTRPGPGDWDGLHFGTYDRGSYIEGASIEYGGDSGYGNIYVVNSNLVTIADSVITDSSESGVYVSNATVDISGTTLSDNTDYGLYLSTNADISTTRGPTFTGNTLTGNGLYPMTVPAAYVGQVDGSNVFSGNYYDYLYVYSGTIASTTTLEALDVPYYLAGDITVGTAAGMVFTIEDGVDMHFASGAALNIGSSSYTDFYVQGTTEGVDFTSWRSSPRAGDWDGIFISQYAQVVEIDGAAITYGGANAYGNVYLYQAADVTITDSVISDSSTNGVYVSWYSTPTILDTVIADNADYGLYVYTYGSLDGDASFDGNTVTGNDVGVWIPASDIGALGNTGTYAGNTTADVQVDADTVATTSSMRDLDVFWHVVGDINVAGSARPMLTIEDGAEVRFDTGTGLTLGSGSYGGLEIDGGTLGVVLTSAESAPAAGDWDGLFFTWYALDSTLTGCDIGYGGANGAGNIYQFYAGYSSSAGALVIDDCVIHDSSTSGIYSAVADDLAISDTTIEDNGTYGMYLATTAALETTGAPTFSGNVVTGNGLYPVSLGAASMGQLDDSSVYSGNGIDRIYVDGETLTTSATWQDLDVPWLIASDIAIYNAASPVITIESGTTLLFNTLSGLHFGQFTYGTLVANGTAAEPIVFTSAQTVPAPGDWDGIALGTYDTGSRLSYVEVSYGGSGYSGNIWVYGNASRVSISDATVSYSEDYGIYRSSSATPTLTSITYASNTDGTLY